MTGLAVRKGRNTEEKGRAFPESRADLSIEIEDPPGPGYSCRVGQYKLTAYDASWLEFAIRHNLPIAALDKELVRAARETDVILVQI